MPRPKRGRNPYAKYKAKRVEIDGHKFPSKAEARRYTTLKERQKQGRISDLKLQPRFKIRNPVTKKVICTYVGDFLYRDKGGHIVLEDVKGVRTDVYALKKKMMAALDVTGPLGDIEYPPIREVKSLRRTKAGTEWYVWSVDGLIEED